jgi:hypothetical protein
LSVSTERNHFSVPEPLIRHRPTFITPEYPAVHVNLNA